MKKALLIAPLLMVLSCSLDVGREIKVDPKLLGKYQDVTLYCNYETGQITVRYVPDDLTWEINNDNFYYVKIDNYGISKNIFFIYNTFYRLVEFNH